MGRMETCPRWTLRRADASLLPHASCRRLRRRRLSLQRLKRCASLRLFSAAFRGHAARLLRVAPAPSRLRSASLRYAGQGLRSRFARPFGRGCSRFAAGPPRRRCPFPSPLSRANSFLARSRARARRFAAASPRQGFARLACAYLRTCAATGTGLCSGRSGAAASRP